MLGVKPVAFIRCGAGHYKQGSPLGLIPDFVNDPINYLCRTVQRAVDDGYDRIIISRPSGRYPGTPMHGHDWYCTPDYVKEAIATVKNIEGVESLGIYTGSAFATSIGQIPTWSMGPLDGWKEDPTRQDYDLMLLPWITEMEVNELWVDATSPSYRRVNFVRWAATTGLRHQVNIVGEAWPLRSKAERKPGAVIDPAIHAIPWFCLGRFLRAVGAKPNEIEYPYLTERYIAEVGGDKEDEWTREQIENWGATWVQYYP